MRLAIARAGEAAGCREALFTLGISRKLATREARRGSGPARAPIHISLWRECGNGLRVNNTDAARHLGVMSATKSRCFDCGVSQGTCLESSFP